jgi:hypothetical protein
MAAVQPASSAGARIEPAALKQGARKKLAMFSAPVHCVDEYSVNFILRESKESHLPECICVPMNTS